MKFLQRVRVWIEKKYTASDFELKKIRRVRFWIRKFTTRKILKKKSACEILYWKIYNKSDFKLKVFHFSFNPKF